MSSFKPGDTPEDVFEAIKIVPEPARDRLVANMAALVSPKGEVYKIIGQIAATLSAPTPRPQTFDDIGEHNYEYIRIATELEREVASFLRERFAPVLAMDGGNYVVRVGPLAYVSRFERVTIPTPNDNGDVTVTGIRDPLQGVPTSEMVAAAEAVLADYEDQYDDETAVDS